MEQRPLRLGDVVDDYCPRERRVTNHAIVAIVEDVIRQTRCTACDAEHPYKGAREPRLRRKEPDRLYEQVLADVTGAPPSPAPPLAAAASEPPATEPPASTAAASAPQEPEPRDEDRGVDGWLAQRQLIRATLPRTDSEPTPRPIPEFTMYQRQTRGSRAFRQFANGNGNGTGNGDINGNVAGRGHGGRHGKPGRRHRNKRPR